MSYVKLENIEKKYNNNNDYSVQDFNLEIEKGEFIVLVGPSGCGKSTTIRMIAGLEEVSGGKIFIEDEEINKKHPKDRNVAMVFQNYALYPHLSVKENITIGLKARKAPKDEIEKKLNWIINILGMEEYLDIKPGNLSGGQKQRVAVGRAMVRNPKLFLMDEPLSNLDAKLRVKMRNEITSLHNELNVTTIYVTHDQVEAMTMADRIVIMKDGKIMQIGTPKEVYNEPLNIFVAGFIGAPHMTLLDVEVEGEYVLLKDGNKLKIPLGKLKEINHLTGECVMGIRPEFANFNKVFIENNKNSTIEQEILIIEDMGNEQIMHVKIKDDFLIIKVPNTVVKKIKEKLEISIDMNKVYFFDKKTQQIIK